MKFRYLLILFLLIGIRLSAQSPDLKSYNLTWTSQSKNAGESMPCGGGDIGLNVWEEKGDICFYISRSGTFDENNTFLKLGRVKLTLQPNALNGTVFKQQLVLEDGSVLISGTNGKLNTHVKLWVDVFRPVIHAEITSNEAIKTAAAYESWRYKDRAANGTENNQD